jgi:transcriptional regulator with XRE-family HTH domain
VVLHAPALEHSHVPCAVHCSLTMLQPGASICPNMSDRRIVTSRLGNYHCANDEGGRISNRLTNELGKRRQINPRYSLRAFATFLGTNHSTVSQVLRGKRRIPVPLLRQWSKRLGMTTEEAAAYVAIEHVPDPTTTRRQEQLRNWTAEALAILNDQTHWQIVRNSQMPGLSSRLPLDRETIGCERGSGQLGPQSLATVALAQDREVERMENLGLSQLNFTAEFLRFSASCA